MMYFFYTSNKVYAILSVMIKGINNYLTTHNL
jgi:hypothetical protein